MRTTLTGDEHVINLASMSAFGPVPGLAVYASTKHAVLGFTTSLQGDLRSAGLRIRVHAVCPDGADTPMVQERAGDRDSAIIWSGSRLLTAEEVADRPVALLDSRRIVLALPRHRGAARPRARPHTEHRRGTRRAAAPARRAQAVGFASRRSALARRGAGRQSVGVGDLGEVREHVCGDRAGLLSSLFRSACASVSMLVT